MIGDPYLDYHKIAECISNLLFILRPAMMVPPGCAPLMTSSPTIRASQKFDLARDIFKCVICHERFNSLDGLTRHLKETDHGSNTTDRQKCSADNLSPDVSPTGDIRMSFSR